ncbi:hypothetical protein CERSUDRAFT_92439 [Gelatoporia subvermispora B]|uniref:Uncharacterized protein n=1 Tax=Ceriporiopsis subvermispora (strain B) TaxID=914234 RepID=M2RM94_CERS8|nr:hypothetical protein CERSUDRAFT_92439 [Gelatoporia subvermispora B]
MAMSSWPSGDIPQAGNYSSTGGLQSEQANTSLSTDRWMAIRASSLWRDRLCEYRPTVIPGGAADSGDHGPIPQTVSEQVKAHEERAVASEALQPVPQYGARTEHSKTANEPVESVVLSRNLPRQGSQEAPPQLRVHEYRLVVGGLSIILLHPQQSEDVGVIEAFEPPPRSTWLYEVALKYAGSEPPARARVAIKNSKKRNGSGRFNPRSKKNESKSGEKGVRKGNGETCLVCSSLQKKCPAKLGELCL